MKKITVTTIFFQDNGQDFLEWDISESGKVIACRPFQAQVWIGCTVIKDTITVGYRLDFTTKDNLLMNMNYIVESVTTKKESS